MSWQKALGADPKAIQQIESSGQSKKGDGVNADGAQSMFVLIFSTRNEKTRLKFSQGNTTVLKNMANFEKVKLKQTNNLFK